MFNYFPLIYTLKRLEQTKLGVLPKLISSSKKKDALLSQLGKLWENSIFRALFLIILALLGSFVLQEGLVLALRTEHPLHTPISGSMHPTLKIGDLLIIRGGLSANDIIADPQPVGDIIIFPKPGHPDELIVHRAIRKFQEDGEWYFITKGDANAFDDWQMWRWKISESDVVGKVIVSIPLLGYFLRFLDETKAYFGEYGVTLRTVLIIVLIVALFLLEYTSSSEKQEKPQESEETDVKNDSSE